MEFILYFSPSLKKEKENPTTQTTHLQTAASQPCKPKFEKELFLA
jgi:hypothetical protein